MAGTPSIAHTPPGPGGLIATLRRWVPAALFAAWLVYALRDTGFHLDAFRDLSNIPGYISQMFPADFTIWREVMRELVRTLNIALVGTLMAFLVAVPTAFVAASNTAPGGIVFHVVRSALSFARAVPEILWALIFVVAFDIGPLPGVVALAVHNWGILGKIIAEMIEAADVGPVEAVVSTGARRPLVIWFGILPQVLPNLVSYSLFRFECNIRTATVLGLVGAGGIGQMIMITFKLFNYAEIPVEVLGVLLLVVSVDYIGTWVRRMVI